MTRNILDRLRPGANKTMAKEINLNKNYKSTDEFKAAVKAALLIISEGVIRIHTWYDNAEGGSVPYTNIMVQQKYGPLSIDGTDIECMDYYTFNISALRLIKDAIAELRNSGIHVYPRIMETWQL